MYSPHLLYAAGRPARGVSVREGAVTDSDGILAGPTERIGPAGTIGRGKRVGDIYRPPLHPEDQWPAEDQKCLSKLVMYTWRR